MADSYYTHIYVSEKHIWIGKYSHQKHQCQRPEML